MQRATIAPPLKISLVSFGVTIDKPRSKKNAPVNISCSSEPARLHIGLIFLNLIRTAPRKPQMPPTKPAVTDRLLRTLVLPSLIWCITKLIKNTMTKETMLTVVGLGRVMDEACLELQRHLDLRPHSPCASDGLRSRPTSGCGANPDGRQRSRRTDRTPRAPETQRTARSKSRIRLLDSHGAAGPSVPLGRVTWPSNTDGRPQQCVVLPRQERRRLADNPPQSS